MSLGGFAAKEALKGAFRSGLTATLSPIVVWIITGVVALLIGAAGIHLWHDHTVRKERDAAIEAKGRLQERVDNLAGINDRNKIEMDKCIAANQANAVEADRINAQGRAAAARAKIRAAAHDLEAEKIRHEGKAFDNHLACPAYTVDFRQWVCRTANQDCH